MEELLAPNFDPAMAKPVSTVVAPATVVEIAREDITATVIATKPATTPDSNDQASNSKPDDTATVVDSTTVVATATEDIAASVVTTPPVDDLASVVETTNETPRRVSAEPNSYPLPVETVNPVSTRVVETCTVVASATVVETREPDLVTRRRQADPTVVETATVDASVNDSLYSERVVSPNKIGLLAQARPPREIASDWESLTTGKTYPAKNIQFVSIAQHSMSGGQERFYESIWRSKSDYKFRVDIESREVKRFCAGYDVLSQVCRLATRNVRNMIPVLISKLILYSFRDHDSTVRKGTTYQIFSYEEILRRQRARGLCYVIKNGPSVEFVAPVGWTVDPASTVGVPTTVAKSSTVAADVSSRGTVDAVSRITMDETSRPLDRSNSSSQSTTSTLLRELLQAQLAKFDYAAIDQLWAACRKNVPDVTVEEVSELFSLKRRIAFAPGVKNPNGLLITAVANACTPAAISEMRKGREAAEEPEITRTREEQIADLEFYIREFPPDHEQMADWKARLQKLREGN
jgi:hypothetical protein